MKSLLVLTGILLLLVDPVVADPVDAILDRAKADCSAFENGEFEATDAVV